MIQVHGQYDLTDYKKAMKLNIRRGRLATWFGYVSLGFIGLMVLGGLLSMLVISDSSSIRSLLPGLLVALLFPALLVLLWFVLMPRQMSRVFRQQKDLSAPFDMTLSDTEFHLQNDFGVSRVPWNVFTKWKEDSDLFLVYRSDAIFHMIPKRLLHGQEGIQYVRTKLQTNGVLPASQVKNSMQVTLWVIFAAVLILVFAIQFVMQLQR